jgi:tetratricopeptide (TPR) repeat protein
MAGLGRGGLVAAVLAGMLFALPVRAPGEEAARRAFQEGNAAFEAGDWAAAIAAYRRAARMGIRGPELEYNWGNAYFRADSLGRAVLHWERALRLNPRHPDARANLRYARALLQDRQFLLPRHRFVRWVVAVHDRLRRTEAALLALLAAWAGWVLLAVRASLDLPGVVRWYRRASWISPGRWLGLSPGADLLLLAVLCFTLAGAGGASLRAKAKDRDRAVVVVPSVEVRSAPDEGSTLQFELHEGTTLWIRERRGRWVRVRLPGELDGWLPADAVERIDAREGGA